MVIQRYLFRWEDDDDAQEHGHECQQGFAECSEECLSCIADAGVDPCRFCSAGQDERSTARPQER